MEDSKESVLSVNSLGQHVFDEASLYREVCRTWGAHGAHAEVLRDLMKAASASRSELLQAAKAVAFSNGFDAAYQDKLETLRSVVRKYQGE